jgi:hypothetical protein
MTLAVCSAGKPLATTIMMSYICYSTLEKTTDTDTFTLFNHFVHTYQFYLSDICLPHCDLFTFRQAS